MPYQRRLHTPSGSWDLFFFLPNLNPPTPTPFDGGAMRICAGNDPVITRLRQNPGNTTAQQMLGAFCTQFGTSFPPACFIVDPLAPPFAREAAALRSFRNCCAIATLLPSYDGRQWRPKFADHFDLYPLAAAKSGRIATNDAIVAGLHKSQGFSGQSSPLIQDPSHFACHPSRRLLDRLLYAWNRCYLERRERRPLLRLFRSLEIALHALRFPTDSLMSVHDAGLRLVLWVSAFEVLLHPGNKRVDLASVLSFMRGLPWRDRRLIRKQYRVKYKNGPPRVSKPEAIYFDLYIARNDFAHGNEIPAQRLWFRRQRNRGLLSDLAPLVYWNALEQRMNLLLSTSGTQPPLGAGVRWLLTNRGRRYMRHRMQEWAERRNAEAALVTPH